MLRQHPQQWDCADLSRIIQNVQTGSMQDHDSRGSSLPPDDDGDASPEGGRRKSTKKRRKLSEVLTEIATDDSRDRISITDLMEAMRLRAASALILLFALPNALPALPGTSAILGLPLLYLCFQMAMGRAPWLPKFIAERSMLRSDFAALLTRMGPLLTRAERYLRPRLAVLTTPTAERVLGAFCAFLALLVALPIPLGNMLPAFAISMIALGVLERDGAWILGGTIVGIVSIIIVWGVLVVFVKAIGYVLAGAFG